MAMYIPEFQRKPHLFLSHSSKDKDFVLQLADDLSLCQVDVWLDEWEIKPGDSLFDKLSKGIEDSKYVGLVLTQSFLDSKWSSNELKQAIQKETRNNGTFIVPLLKEQIAVPAFIEDKIYISFISNYHEGIFRLAALIHEIESRRVSDALRHRPPASMKDVKYLLHYCNFDPYVIIPKQVFDEIARSGAATVKDNKVSFGLEDILYNKAISEGTKSLLTKLLNEANADNPQEKER